MQQAQSTQPTRGGEAVQFSPELLAKVTEIISRYPEGKQKSALLPVLHMAQDTFGWLSIEAMDYVASLLSLAPVEVYEVATFYSMYNMRPVGKYLLEVCHTGPCMIRGSDNLLEHIQTRLGIKIGQTTPDGMFTLKTVECLAACGYAPMMQVGENYHEHLDPAKVDALIDAWRAQSGVQMHQPTIGTAL